MFALTNARGETVDINNDKLLSYTPTGLGVQFTNTYSQYETYFKATKSTVTQGQFQIYILFGDVESQAYQTFSDFAQFLAYQPLTLTYTTDSGTWYRDGRLNSLTKTEIGGSTVFATDRINESFTLEFINNWYNNKTAEYKSYDADPNLGTHGKIYHEHQKDELASSIVGKAIVGETVLGNTQSNIEQYNLYYYLYAPYYVYKESTINAGEKMMPLVNDSKYFGVQQGSPCIMTIVGATTNPHWTVLQNGITVATDGFTLTLAHNQRLIVSSYPEDQYARVYNPDGSFSDVSQLQDYTKTNFVQIPEGESTVLVYVDKDTNVGLTFREERLLV